MRIARFAHTGGMSFGVVQGAAAPNLDPNVATVAEIDGHLFCRLVALLRILCQRLADGALEFGRHRRLGHVRAA